MGFGASTTVGNVAVDLVQTDVDAIIAGIANGKTLAGIDTTLTTIDGVLDSILLDTDDLQYLYSSSASSGVADLLQYSGYSAGYYLQNIEGDTSYLSSMSSYLSSIDSNTNYLYSSSAGYGVADLLYNYLYYSGYSAVNLLYEIEANTSDMTDIQYLYSSSSGYGVADELYYYLYDSSNYKPWLQEMCELLNGYDSYSPLFYNGYSAAYYLEHIYTILSDVWDSGNHALKTKEQAA